MKSFSITKFYLLYDTDDNNGIAPVGGIDTSDERKAFDQVDDSKDEEDKPDVENDKVDEDEDQENLESGEEDEDKEDDPDKEDELEEEKSDSLISSLKKTSPELFKKHPELRGVIFREQQYSEFFPTVEDAKEAAEAAETFNTFQEDIASGNPETLLEAVKEIGSDNLENFAANFLPSLEKVSKETYYQVIYPEFKKMLRFALSNPDENVKQSARNINFILFGDTDVEKDAGLKPRRQDPREDRVSKREKELEDRIYNNFFTEVGGTSKGRAFRIISKAFEGSDMSPLIQKNLTEEIYKRVGNEMAADGRHMATMNNLWKQARKAGFTTEWKDRITNAYLSRAKVLIPKLRQQVLSEAKVSSVRSGKNIDRPKRIAGTSGVQNVANKPVSAKKVDWDKTSERDLLDGKFVAKG